MVLSSSSPIEITNGEKDWEGFMWVIKACGGGAHPKYSLIYSLGRYVITTDGVRLHAYRPEKIIIPKGVWSWIKDKKRLLLTLSEEENIFSPKMLLDVFPRHEKHVKVNIVHNISGAYTALIRAMDSGHTADYDLFKELISPTNYYGGFIRVGSEGAPLWMKNGRKSGLIMPMRM